MCTSIQPTYLACGCGCKVKAISSQCFNAKMARNGGSCTFVSTRFTQRDGLCPSCFYRQAKEQARLELAMQKLELSKR